MMLVRRAPRNSTCFFMPIRTTEGCPVPAVRQRNENWRQSLQQLFERGGALEISLPSASADPEAEKKADACIDDIEAQAEANLIWRVKIVNVEGDTVDVEAPVALGRTIEIDAGMNVVAIMAIGQNRWMFGTEVLRNSKTKTHNGRMISVLTLRLPETVDRLSRRSHYRVGAHHLALPQVTCWPLLDPASAAIAERAIQAQIEAAQANPDQARDSQTEQLALPEVGPPFQSTLANIGGGGIGLIIDKDNAGGVGRHRTFWLRVDLSPCIEVPLAVTARMVHTHMDSAQRTYAGMAFEFGHNKPHQKFVVDQLLRFVDYQQQCQYVAAGEGEKRRKAS